MRVSPCHLQARWILSNSPLEYLRRSQRSRRSREWYFGETFFSGSSVQNPADTKGKKKELKVKCFYKSPPPSRKVRSISQTKKKEKRKKENQQNRQKAGSEGHELHERQKSVTSVCLTDVENGLTFSTARWPLNYRTRDWLVLGAFFCWFFFCCRALGDLSWILTSTDIKFLTKEIVMKNDLRGPGHCLCWLGALQG